MNIWNICVTWSKKVTKRIFPLHFGSFLVNPNLNLYTPRSLTANTPESWWLEDDLPFLVGSYRVGPVSSGQRFPEEEISSNAAGCRVCASQKKGASFQRKSNVVTEIYIYVLQLFAKVTFNMLRIAWRNFIFWCLVCASFFLIRRKKWSGRVEEFLHQSKSLELMISNKTLGKTTPISQGSLGSSSVSWFRSHVHTIFTYMGSL